jgi:hypothetical protein
VKLPDYIKRGDTRGHEAETDERRDLEVTFEQVLEAAEGRARESMVALRGFEPRFDG